MIEIHEPQPGWKRCPKCGRDGFRPPWQGYCHDCQRAYYRDRNAKKRAEKEEWTRNNERTQWHEQLRWAAVAQGLDPDTVEYSDPPWWTTPDPGTED